jgi:chromosome segregation ATPase
MADNNDVIAEIKVKAEDALRAMAELKLRNDELRKSESELQAQIRAGTGDRQANIKALADTTAEIKINKDSIAALEREVKNVIQTEKAHEGSLNGLRAELSRATAAYNAMSKAEREGVKGSETRLRMAAITAELKKAEEAYGDHRRSVGDYAKATRDLRNEAVALIDKLAQLKKKGQENSEEYKSMAANLDLIKSRMANATGETVRLTSAREGIAGLSDGVRLLSGSFGLFNSVAGLSAGEGEELQRVMKNLQIAMTALMSAEAIRNALQKNSALLMGVNALRGWALKKSIEGTTVATGKATIAQRIFNLVAKANPYVLLAMGLAALITLLASFSARADTSAKSQVALNNRSKEYLDIVEKQNDAIKENAEKQNQVINDRIRVLEAEEG